MGARVNLPLSRCFCLACTSSCLVLFSRVCLPGSARAPPSRRARVDISRQQRREEPHGGAEASRPATSTLCAVCLTPCCQLESFGVSGRVDAAATTFVDPGGFVSQVLGRTPRTIIHGTTSYDVETPRDGWPRLV